MSQPARWTLDGPPGSVFHEFIVLPTLAPELARHDPLSASTPSSSPSSVSSTGQATSDEPSQEVPLPDPARGEFYAVANWISGH